MITSITLNPAIDKTLFVNNFKIDKLNEVSEIELNAGGKGIVVSKIIKALGYNTTTLGVAGGDTGKKLIDILDTSDIPNDFVWAGEETRTNTKIIDKFNKTCTELDEPGPFINNVHIRELKEKIEGYALDTEYFIISGDVQKNLKSNVYRELIKFIKKIDPDKKIVLDADEDFLAEGIKEAPWMIKPNLDELSEYSKKSITTMEEIKEEALKIIDQGVTYVCVSMGKNGMVFVSRNKAIHARPPAVSVIDTNNCGEVLVASLVVGFKRESSIDDIVKMACAISTASAASDRTEDINRREIDKIYRDIAIQIY